MNWVNTYNVLSEYSKIIIDKYKAALINDNRVTSSAIAGQKLTDSITFNIKTGSTDYSVELSLNYYWKFIEEGVNGTKNDRGSEYSFKKAFANVGAISEWINAKPVLPKPMTLKKTGKQVLPTPKQLSYLISKSVAEKGIRGGHYLEKTLNDIEEELTERLAVAVEQDIMNFLAF